MTSRQGSTISWSSYNYPTSLSAGSGSTAETASLSYAPSRQRWQQIYTGYSTTEIIDYVGRNLEVVSAGGVTNYRHYIYAGNEMVAVYWRNSGSPTTFTLNYGLRSLPRNRSLHGRALCRRRRSLLCGLRSQPWPVTRARPWMLSEAALQFAGTTTATKLQPPMSTSARPLFSLA
jgi:hypothetical protein